jgi:cation diffusion facilitator CzcD-associated flavoprotein CzcO
MQDYGHLPDGLDALTARARRELTFIDHPSLAWRPAGGDGSRARPLDVLIVGGGQSGLATAFGLKRRKVESVLVIEAEPRGAEGPWRTYARMPTLRSPKEFTGPDLDIPCLTYRAWHEARFGAEDWDALKLIPKGHWADYLDWYRDTLDLPVENDCRLTGLTMEGDLVAASVEGAAGPRVVFCRRVVLATGLDGMGRWWMPPEIEALPPERRNHTRDAIDFAALKGRCVAVIGAGASAADNAATALEAGAAEVLLLVRRPELQRVQPYRWLSFAGFMQHFSALSDEWRWRFMAHILGLREGFPQDTYNRCVRHPNFRLVEGAAVNGATMVDTSVSLDTDAGPIEVDHVICGTGFSVEPQRRPELAALAPHIRTWGDAYSPPPDERADRLAAFPYLAEDYSLQEKTPGAAPILSRIHVFGIASTVSFGPSGSSINAMTLAVPKLVAGVTRGLFEGDIDHYWRSLMEYDVRQIVYDGEQAVEPPSAAPKA